VPAGETAWCYRLTDDRGGRWFLKLSRPGAIERARAEFALELAGTMADLGLPVPRPRPTRSGRRWCWLDGLRVTVFELVERVLCHRDLIVDNLLVDRGGRRWNVTDPTPSARPTSTGSAGACRAGRSWRPELGLGVVGFLGVWGCRQRKISWRLRPSRPARSGMATEKATTQILADRSTEPAVRNGYRSCRLVPDQAMGP
jgi:hypothetical protein